MIAIINYGMGNLKSVENALNHLYIDAKIINDPNDLNKFQAAILPGVGSFNKAMTNLNNLGWTKKIHDFVLSKPLLGICLGMQLLMTSSDEGGRINGLNLIKGEVKKIPNKDGFNLPHVGWNEIEIVKSETILKNVKEDIDVYFVHSYECLPENKDEIICNVNYGKKIVAGIQKANVYGLQFHPEKSQPSGLKMLQNFYSLIS